MDLADLRRALHHGEDRSTVTNWVYGRRSVDPVVDALVGCLERLPNEARAEVLAPMPEVVRDRIGLVRLLLAYGMLDVAAQERVRENVSDPSVTASFLDKA